MHPFAIYKGEQGTAELGTNTVMKKKKNVASVLAPSSAVSPLHYHNSHDFFLNLFLIKESQREILFKTMSLKDSAVLCIAVSTDLMNNGDVCIAAS